jgi:glycine cleavage system H protein
LSESEVFGTIEAVKTVSDLFMPMTGEVTEINSGLEDNPEIVNSDPYGEGWMIKIKFAESLDELLTSEQYQELIGE